MSETLPRASDSRSDAAADDGLWSPGGPGGTLLAHLGLPVGVEPRNALDSALTKALRDLFRHDAASLERMTELFGPVEPSEVVPLGPEPSDAIMEEVAQRFGRHSVWLLVLSMALDQRESSPDPLLAADRVIAGCPYEPPKPDPEARDADAEAFHARYTKARLESPVRRILLFGESHDPELIAFIAGSRPAGPMRIPYRPWKDAGRTSVREPGPWMVEEARYYMRMDFHGHDTYSLGDDDIELLRDPGLWRDGRLVSGWRKHLRARAGPFPDDTSMHDALARLRQWRARRRAERDRRRSRASLRPPRRFCTNLPRCATGAESDPQPTPTLTERAEDAVDASASSHAHAADQSAFHRASYFAERFGVNERTVRRRLERWRNENRDHPAGPNSQSPLRVSRDSSIG